MKSLTFSRVDAITWDSPDKLTRFFSLPLFQRKNFATLSHPTAREGLVRMIFLEESEEPFPDIST